MNEPLPSPEDIQKIPPEGGGGFNRLIHATSPYLLQHARNPVDWHEWGPSAFAQAVKEGKPVFLSVGYSTCHWCHVMARESFERAGIAEVLNANFIPIKVDREERPDLDEIYMTATQLFSGRGGWPNSVWLTPDGRPWYAGTYFPPEDVMGVPGFKSLLKQLGELWRTRRAEVEKQANEFAEAMRKASVAGRPGADVAAADLLKTAFKEMENSFDERFGGFGAEPKFPPHSALRLLAHLQHGGTEDTETHGETSQRCQKETIRSPFPPPRSPCLRVENDRALKMMAGTLDAMARGGIRDHVGGGFHRYSTDARWFLPHFEKMLYDNAQLARAYAEGFALTGNEDFSAAARDICDWVLREMADPAGGFHSALDADSEGQEGKFYVWTRAEIIEALGNDEGDAFCRSYGVEERGNFRDDASDRAAGSNILYLRDSLEKLAESAGLPAKGLRDRLRAARNKLLQCRAARIRPHCDDKVLAGWNGLMIGGLAFAGKALGEPRFIAAAERAAGFVLTAMRQDGRLLRSYRQGSARLNAYLEDYAFLADGLLDLHAATGRTRWLEEAKALADVMKARYWDAAHGGFYLTSDDHEALLLRSKSSYDQATPSGNGVAARALIRLWRLTGEAEYLETARATLNAFLGLMQTAPQAAHSLILATAMLLEAKEAAEIATQKPVVVEVSPSTAAVRRGETLKAALRVTISKGYHISSHKPLEDNLVPTELTLDGKGVASLDKVTYPAGKEMHLGSGGKPLSVYEAAVTIRAQIAVAAEAEPGKTELALNLRVQPCTADTCLAPQTISVPLALEIS